MMVAMGMMGLPAGGFVWRCLKGLRKSGLWCGLMAVRRARRGLLGRLVWVGPVRGVWFIGLMLGGMGGLGRPGSLGWLGARGS